MIREYKTFRFSYDAKYMLDQLIFYYEQKLHERTVKEDLLDNITDTVMETYDLYGVSVNLDLRITAGSVIELAVKSTNNLTLSDWKILESEVETIKKEIHNYSTEDAVPRVYIAKDTIRQLEDLHFSLREDSPRGPKIPYIIKLALYHLYKQTLG